MAQGAPRVLLISLRDPHDDMALHEAQCFADQADLPLENLHVHPMAEGRPDLGAGWDAVLFGGSGAYSVLDDVAWIREGTRLVLEVIDRRLPSFASCFGFQAAALALGGTVNHDRDRAEIGSTVLHRTAAGAVDPLFSVLPDTFDAQEGHHDHVDVLPEGVDWLVRGDAIPHQALRVRGAPFWATQFHPELTARTTLDRFYHYGEHYLDPDEADEILARIAAGRDTPELAELLRQVVRWGAGA